MTSTAKHADGDVPPAEAAPAAAEPAPAPSSLRRPLCRRRRRPVRAGSALSLRGPAGGRRRAARPRRPRARGAEAARRPARRRRWLRRGAARLVASCRACARLCRRPVSVICVAPPARDARDVDVRGGRGAGRRALSPDYARERAFPLVASLHHGKLRGVMSPGAHRHRRRHRRHQGRRRAACAGVCRGRRALARRGGDAGGRRPVHDAHRRRLRARPAWTASWPASPTSSTARGAVEGIGVGVASHGRLRRRARRRVGQPAARRRAAARPAASSASACPSSIDNDATAAAIGEHVFGAGVGAREMLMLTLGTGVGGGIICGGRPLSRRQRRGRRARPHHHRRERARVPGQLPQPRLSRGVRRRARRWAPRRVAAAELEPDSALGRALAAGRSGRQPAADAARAGGRRRRRRRARARPASTSAPAS